MQGCAHQRVSVHRSFELLCGALARDEEYRGARYTSVEQWLRSLIRRRVLSVRYPAAIAVSRICYP